MTVYTGPYTFDLSTVHIPYPTETEWTGTALQALATSPDSFLQFVIGDFYLDPLQTYDFEIDLGAYPDGDLPFVVVYSQLSSGTLAYANDNSWYYYLKQSASVSPYTNGAAHTIPFTMGPGLDQWDAAMAAGESRMNFTIYPHMQVTGLRLITGTSLAGPAAPVPDAVTDLGSTSGRNRDGYGIGSWSPGVALPPPPPAGIPVPPVQLSPVVMAQAFGPVAVNGGSATYSVSQATAPRARSRIVVDGLDISYFRGVATPIPSYTLMEPLLYGPGSLLLPQVVACFETLGAGDLWWVHPGAAVQVQRVLDGVVVATDYKGIMISFNTSGNGLNIELGGEASGRAALRNRQVPIFPRVNDLGHQMADLIRDLNLPFYPSLGPVTGIEGLVFGGGSHLDVLDEVIAKAWTRAGKQWTVMPNEISGIYTAYRKNTATVHGTVFADDTRTVADLTRDISEEPNRIYITGVTPQGKRVRFGVYPGLIQGPAPAFPGHMQLGDTGEGVRLLIGRLHAVGYLKLVDVGGGYDSDVVAAVKNLQKDAGLNVTGEVNLNTWNALYDLTVTGLSLEWAHIEPAAQRSIVRPWDRSGSGTILRVNPDYDPNHLVRDRNIDLGTGFDRSQMKEFALTELYDSNDPNWVGTIFFGTGALLVGNVAVGSTISAANLMDARALRPGMNVYLPLFDGGTFVHVSSCEVDAEGGVSASVDTRARSAMEVWEVIARNTESRNDPARKANRKRRSSTIQKDSIGEWDEIGGLLGNDVLLEKGWNVFPVVAAMEGTIAKIRLVIQPEREFACAVFGDKVGPNYLNGLIPRPLTAAGTKMWHSKRDELQEHEFLYAAGTNEDPCGYYPGKRHTKERQVEETNPDYDPSADANNTGSDDTKIQTVTITETYGNVTGRHVDEAGFAYRSVDRTQVHIAVWVGAEGAGAKVRAGRVLWPQLEAGV